MNVSKITKARPKARRAHRVRLVRKGTTSVNRNIPAFINGIARIFDFTGSMNRRRYLGSGFEADAAALRSDWIAVGNDIRTAIGQFETQESNRNSQGN